MFNIKILKKEPIFWLYSPLIWIKVIVAVVLFPCLVELPLADEPKVMPKENYCLTMTRESFDKHVSNIFGYGWVLEHGNFWCESFNEAFRNDAKSIPLPNIKSDNSSNDASKNTGFLGSNHDDDLWLIIGLIPSIWLMLWYLHRGSKNLT